MKITRLLILAALTALAACAMNQQTVRLNPTLDPSVASGPKASGSVALRVIDSRTTEIIGRRGHETGSVATITTDQNLAELIRTKVAEGFISKGFQITSFDASAPRSLTIKLERLDSVTIESTVAINAVMSITGVNGTKTLTQTYRAEREQKVVMTPVQKTNEEWLNEVLSDILTKLCGDPHTTAFLSE